MNEIPKVLEPKERVLWEGKPKYAPYMVGIFFISVIVSVFIAFLSYGFLRSMILSVILAPVVLVICVIIGTLSWKAKHYAITNKRAIVQSGIIGRDFKSVEYDKVQNASVNVGLLGVIFKAGDVRIFTGEMESFGTGKGGNTIRPKYDSFVHIDIPYDILKILQQNLSRRKEKLYGGKA